MLTQKINVPFASNPPYERLKMHFGDSGRVVEITMLFEDQPYTPPTGAVATFQAKKPDGTVVTRTDGVSISGSTVTVEITSNTLAQIGIVYCECLIFADGHTIGTMRFEIEVMEPAVRSGDIESSDDYQSVAEAVIQAEAARDSAQSAQTGAEDARDTAESYADIAQNIEMHPVIVGTNGNWWNWSDASNAYIDSGISPPIGPQGIQGIPGKDGTSVNIQDGEYREPGSAKPLPDLPSFSSTAEGNAYIVDDDAVDGQLDLYIHGTSGTDWTIVDNWGGIPGEKGDPGQVQSIVEGTNVDVNNADPANPVVSVAGVATPASGSTNLFTAGGAYNLAPKASPTLTGTPAAPTPTTGNNSTQIATTAFVKAALLAMWPVGSIYMSMSSANPSTFIGGAWARTALGRVMIGVEETNGAINGPSKLLGDYNVPIRTYNLPAQSVTYNPQNFNWGAALYSSGSNGYSALEHANPPIASEQPISVIQPSMTCYIWQRTA